MSRVESYFKFVFVVAINIGIFCFAVDQNSTGVIQPNNLKVFDQRYKHGLILQDPLQAGVFDSAFPVSGDVELNGGTLYLNQDLFFGNVTHLKSLGNFIGNSHVIDFGASISALPTNNQSYTNIMLRFNNDITLASSVTIKGHCIITGQQTILHLLDDAKLVLADNSTLEFRNIVVEDVQTKKIQCGQSSKIIIRNSQFHSPTDFEITCDKLQLVNTNAEITTLTGKFLAARKGNLYLDNIPAVFKNRYEDDRLKNNSLRIHFPSCIDKYVTSGDSCDCSSSSLEGESCSDSLAGRLNCLENEILCLKQAVCSICTSNCNITPGNCSSSTDQECVDADSFFEEIAHLIDGKLWSFQADLSSCCDNLNQRVSALESEIETLSNNESCCEMLNELVCEKFETLKDEFTSCCDELSSKISELACCVDSNTCCENLISLVEQLQSCCENINSRIEPLQTCCNIFISQIDSIQTIVDILSTCCENINSRIEPIETCCGIFASQIDVIESIVEVLTSCCDIINSKVEPLESCCAALMTSTGFLQSELDSCCIPLQTSTGFLQSQIDRCCSQLQTSTGFLQSEIDACCVPLRTSTGFLQSQIDLCCSQLQTSTGFLQSEIDACCIPLRTSTGFLQSQIDLCCSQLQTSTGFLQSEIDACCIPLRTSTGFLQSQIDACCSALKTSTGFLQSEIDKCCSALQTSTGFLQSQIDHCCNNVSTQTCVIIITGQEFYNPIAHPEMAPIASGAVIFQFNRCVGANEIPTLIFDPAVYGGGDVNIPYDGQFIFTGEGIAELRGTAAFNLEGVVGDPGSPPNLVAETGAQITLAHGANWGVTGIGRAIIRENATLLLDTQSQFKFGQTANDVIEVLVQSASAIIVANNDVTADDSTNAFVSFGYGTLAVTFDNKSSLAVIRGITELNLDKGSPAQGDITQIHFTDNSSLLIQSRTDQSTRLVMAPNSNNAPVDWDNRVSFVYGNGDMRFRSLDADAVDTTILLQRNFFAVTRPMVEIFMQLGYILGDSGAVIDPSDLQILVRLGSYPDLALTGVLAAIKPARNGSVQQLQQGDHDVAYNFVGGTFIVGYDINGRYFQINSAGVRTTF